MRPREACNQTHFEEHLHLQRCEAVALLHTWVPLQERAGCHPSAHPLDGNHLAMGRDERRVRVLLHEGRLDAWLQDGCRGGKEEKEISLKF